MRKRSMTIHANSVEEFTRLAIQHSTSSQPLVNPFTSGCQHRTISHPNPTLGFAQRSQSEGENQEKYRILEQVATISGKVMVIGSKGAGKFQLINSSFCSKKNKTFAPINQTMDLIVKDDEEEGRKIKYHFWIRTLNDMRFNDVVKVYYRNIATFIFVYSISDRKSFEVLKSNLKEIIADASRTKFMGILIANNSGSQGDREVSYDEGYAIKEEYNLSLFVETDCLDELLKRKLQGLFLKI